MNKPHKSRNSEPNEQSPRNIFEIFSCSWALENFSHSRGLRTDISQKTVVGCPCIVTNQALLPIKYATLETIRSFWTLLVAISACNLSYKPHLSPHHCGVRQEYWQSLSYLPSAARAGSDKIKANESWQDTSNATSFGEVATQTQPHHKEWPPQTILIH